MTSPPTRQGPDFLIIGAQRAGTTWLHRVLAAHPKIWMPPIKELHYFDDPANKRYYHNLRKRLRSGLSGHQSLSTWDARYFLGRGNDDWYCGLFARGRRQSKVTGEATPAYATLDDKQLERLRSLNPEVRLIFSMRDPVARSWSAIANARRKGRISDASLEARSEVVLKSNYLYTIDRYERVFPRDQLHCCFFDHIRDQPEELVMSILGFLEVDPGDVRTLLPKRPVNVAAGNTKPPRDLEKQLAEALLPSLIGLCERFDGPPHRWRDRYVELLNRATATGAFPSAPAGE